MCKCSGKCGCKITQITKGEKGDSNSASTLGYKIYRALISQSGTSAPTATVLQNTLGSVPTFTYLGVGSYQITLNITTTQNKLWYHIERFGDTTQVVDTDGLTTLSTEASSDLFIRTVDAALAPLNGNLYLTPIEILVYPA